MVGEASGRMQKADCRDEIALPAAMLAWLKCGKQRTRNSRVSVGLKSPFLVIILCNKYLAHDYILKDL